MSTPEVWESLLSSSCSRAPFESTAPVMRSLPPFWGNPSTLRLCLQLFDLKLSAPAEMAMGIANFESLAYRVPKSEDLEDLLKISVAPYAAYKGEDEVVQTFNRDPPAAWGEYKMSEDAASLRKLWAMSREVCKSEIESLASGDSSVSKQKVGVANSLAMEKDAVDSGMPRPGSDAERPSLYTLTRVSRSLVPPGATYEHIPWEAYIDAEEEGRLSRLGKMPKAQPELVIKDSKLALNSKAEQDLPPAGVVDGEKVMRKALEIRARSFTMTKVASYEVYRRLHDKYFARINATVPSGMRPPTVNEVRRFDRLLHEEITKWLSRNVGELDKGILYYLNHDENSLWRLLDAVVESLPDQGIEKEDSAAAKPAKTPKGTKGEGDEEEKGVSSAKGKKKCLVCGKKHTPFCKLPEGFRKKQRDEQKKRKAEANASSEAKKAK